MLLLLLLLRPVRLLADRRTEDGLDDGRETGVDKISVASIKASSACYVRQPWVMTRLILLLLLLLLNRDGHCKALLSWGRWRERQFWQRRFSHHLTLLLLLMLLLKKLLLQVKLWLHNRHVSVANLDDPPRLNCMASLQRWRCSEPQRPAAVVTLVVIIDVHDVAVVDVAVAVARKISSEGVHELERGHQVILRRRLEQVLGSDCDRRTCDDNRGVLDRSWTDSVSRCPAEDLSGCVCSARHGQLGLFQLLDVRQGVGWELKA